MWRPENWPKVNPNPCGDCNRKEMDDYGFLCDLVCGEHSAYIQREVGADAMLRALRQKGYYIPGYLPNADYSEIIRTIQGFASMEFLMNNRGRLVFIPDEEVKNDRT